MQIYQEDYNDKRNNWKYYDDEYDEKFKNLEKLNEEKNRGLKKKFKNFMALTHTIELKEAELKEAKAKLNVAYDAMSRAKLILDGKLKENRINILKEFYYAIYKHTLAYVLISEGGGNF